MTEFLFWRKRKGNLTGMIWINNEKYFLYVRIGESASGRPQP